MTEQVQEVIAIFVPIVLRVAHIEKHFVFRSWATLQMQVAATVRTRSTPMRLSSTSVHDESYTVQVKSYTVQAKSYTVQLTIYTNGANEVPHGAE